MFYRATKDDLKPIRPVAKFLLIKAIVFLTFWQSIAISIVFSLDLVKTERWTTYDTDDVSAGVQNFFICIEMFVAALVFAYVFPPKVIYCKSKLGTKGMQFRTIWMNLIHAEVSLRMCLTCLMWVMSLMMFPVSQQQHNGFFVFVYERFVLTDHFEDGMIRSKEQVMNVTQQIGRMFKSPAHQLKQRYTHITYLVNVWFACVVSSIVERSDRARNDEAVQSLLHSGSSQGSSVGREVALSDARMFDENSATSSESEVSANQPTSSSSRKETGLLEIIHETDTSPRWCINHKSIFLLTRKNCKKPMIHFLWVSC